MGEGKSIERQKARRLLEMLRLRTQERGATASEAAQAAELAEKIMQRFGIGFKDENAAFRCTMAQKRFPGWAKTLLSAVITRFEVRAEVATQKGKKVIVKFIGPEHRANVAAWLFVAIRSDLDKRSYMAAGAFGKKGPQLVRFRNRFRQSACFEIDRRLNPLPDCEPLSEEEVERIDRECKARFAKMNEKQIASLVEDAKARLHGTKFGQEVSIDTNVLPSKNKSDHQLFLTCEHQSSPNRSNNGVGQ